MSLHGYGIELIEKCVLDLYGVYNNDFYLFLCDDFNAGTTSENLKNATNDFDEMFVNEDNYVFARQSKVIHERNVFCEQLLVLCKL